ncbi:hypothetical protein [Asticcacaulis tiandongensis]|uniref:hypothetical protein n=1 Tax=Asticcacaulis tiandongensis TaxID=2565365 RepID=UPI001127E518|nr:hypothetical protein [Asticcacaulis tiandongensis]
MSRWRGRLIGLGVLVVMVGGVVCYDVYRAQTVARDVIRHAEAGRTSELSALIKSSAITDRLYRDSEGLIEAPVLTVQESAPKKGVFKNLWDKSKNLVGMGDEVAPVVEASAPLDLHLCAQTLGEPKGFSTLIRSLKPEPVTSGFKPDPRIHYGALNTRQYLIRQNGKDSHYLMISRTNLLDWQVTGVRLSENVRKQITRTCLGVI